MKQQQYALDTFRVNLSPNWAKEANEKLKGMGLCATHVITVIPRFMEMEIVYRFLKEQD